MNKGGTALKRPLIGRFLFKRKENENMDYKETLHLPKSDFEMRGNLVKKQGDIIKKWQDEQLYHTMREVNKDCEPYVLHDGPPYANGHIHIGHALNKILKDFVVRSHHKLGYQINFVPGWDTHGLPIENEVTKSGVNRKEVSVAAFRAACEAYAIKQVEQQKQDFINLGTIGDYENPYITYQHDYEAVQVELFAEMVDKKMIYKGLKPVYWSPSSESALAEAEIEYKDKKDPSIYVRFKVNDGKGILDNDTYFVIWTTTPWTIPGNLAISLHPKFDYALVKVNDVKYVLLEEFVEELMKEFGFDHYEVIQTFKGEELEYITTQHPLYNRESLVILGNHVTNDSGTGCVHTAPGFGMDDYIVGQKYGIEPYCNVDNHGKMMEEAGDWLVGQTTEEANKTVTNRLNEQGDLLKLVFITHSYPHDWRTGKPIIFRATPQWFASIDLVREEVLKEIDHVKWQPSWGKLRMHNMIKDRGDWVISRQRAWGLPIPIFYTEDGTPLMDKDLIYHVASLFREHGSNIWFEWEAVDLLPKGYSHPGSPNGRFTKEKDILDVWFDSGSSHTAALKKHGLSVPHDLYLEGSDQYRGWFNSSLIISTAVFGCAPYKNVLSHGFIMDGKGEKFSKSKGNAIKPEKIVNLMGAEILRLWVASVDFTSDISISDDILKQVSENYRKIRNTFRFMHANSSDLHKNDRVDLKTLPAVDRQVLNEVNQVIKNGLEAYREFHFSDITTSITKLLTNVMSAYYLDFTKDILYIHSLNDTRRRQVQTVLSYSLEALMHLIAPILSFTTEELNSIINPGAQSVHLDGFVKQIDSQFNEKETEDFEKLFELREAVYKALEVAREQKLIGNSLKAKVVLNLDETSKSLVDHYFGEDLKQWFIVSQVEYTTETLDEVLGYQVRVDVAEGVECERCWNVVKETTEGVCERCHHHLHQ